jgi:hypothetical protein
VPRVVVTTRRVIRRFSASASVRLGHLWLTFHVRRFCNSHVNGHRPAKAGLNAIELMFLVSLAGVTFGGAWGVGTRFGLGWGLLAVQVTFGVLFTL